MLFEDAGDEWTHSRGFGVAGQGLFIFSNLAEAPAAPEEEVTRITRIAKDRTGTFFLPWVARSVHFIQRAVPTVIFVGLYGEYAIFEDVVERSGLIDSSNFGPSLLGVLRASALVDGRVFAVGMSRQAYMLRCDGDLLHPVWRRIDQRMLSPPGPGPSVGLNAIGGFSATEVYAAGLQGEIWMWSGDDWHPIDSPTNAALECVVCGGDGVVYFAGRRGVILRGRQQRWEQVAHDATDVDFWCALWFADQLLLASSRAIFVLGPDDDLRPILSDSNVPGVTCGWLTVMENKVYSIGPSHVLQTTDLENWEPVAE